MKHRFTALLIISFFSQGIKAQDASGYWYGTGNVENGGSASNYLFEVLIEQNGPSVKAILNYYFKNTYRTFKVNGNFNSQSRNVTLYNIPVTYYKSPVNMEVDCPMDFVGQLRVSRAGSDMKGNFLSRPDYRNTCPTVFFNLKQNKDAGNRDSILLAIGQFKETHQYWTPGESDTLIATTVIQRPVVNYVLNAEFGKRQNEVAKEIEVSSDSLSVDFYDNGEIDGDSISVFFNRQLLTFNRMLSTRAIHFNLALDTTKEINEVSMFANNLGRFPPNTALMTVYDGKQRYEIRLSSNLEKNAVVRIRRRVKKKV